jgi:hypothetical protein
MIVTDLDKAIGTERDFLRQEMIDRLIELLITICRLPGCHQKFKDRAMGTFGPLFARPFSLLGERPLKQERLRTVESEILKIGFETLVRSLRDILPKIVKQGLRRGLIGQEYWPKVLQFLKNPRSCLGCEDLLFTKLRDRSFVEQISETLRQSRPVEASKLGDLIVITVGGDHVEPMVSEITLQFPNPVYAIQSFETSQDTLSKLIDYLLSEATNIEFSKN